MAIKRRFFASAVEMRLKLAKAMPDVFTIDVLEDFRQQVACLDIYDKADVTLGLAVEKGNLFAADAKRIFECSNSLPVIDSSIRKAKRRLADHRAGLLPLLPPRGWEDRVGSGVSIPRENPPITATSLKAL